MLSKFILTIGCVAGLTAVVWSDVDMQTTHRGGSAPSGSRDEANTDQDDAILLELNNEIASRIPVITDPVSPLSASRAMDGQTTGEILQGASAPEAGGTRSRALYDRLNVRAVLRLLLFDQGEGEGHVPFFAPAPRPHSFDNLFDPGAGPVGNGGGGSPLDPTPSPIPEPATVVLMIGAGALAVARRRRQRRKPAEA
jgi:hypothetical protein